MGSSKRSWHGRFSKTIDAQAAQLVQSLSFDHRLYKWDIVGSICHARMLARVGLIKVKEARQIEAALKSISKQIESGRLKFDPAVQEDIHMAIEQTLIKRVGQVGKKLHTGRSRNDQVALDLRLYLRDAIDLELLVGLTDLQRAFVALAERDGRIVMPGQTHLQPAQPVLAGAVLLAYVEQLERDKQRLVDARKRIDCCPLGAGALAGTTLPIDRKMVASQLGFARVCSNSIDAVSDRDFAVEFVFCCSMIAMHLSRWAEDWIIFSSPRFGFIKLDESFCTGSSIMPQKRNPDVLEVIRGKSGGLFANLQALLVMLKSQPLAYNRDMQEDKRWVFEAHDSIGGILAVAPGLVNTSSFDAQTCRESLCSGYLEATGLAEYLVNKGVAFRQAHNLVGKLVARCERQGIGLGQVSLDQLQGMCKQIRQDVYEYLDPVKLVDKYQSLGAAGTAGLKKQLASWKRKLKLK